MAQKHRFHNQRGGRRDGPRLERPPLVPYVPKPPVEYGKPVMILEDTARSTFEFKGGAWIPFAKSIAQCRLDCIVKELPQKINQMTRYEVRFPLPT